MVSDTTVEKKGIWRGTMKSIGHEKVPVLVCWTAMSDRIKFISLL